jgi:hypothetical protein
MVYARVRNRESNRKAEEVAAEAERKQTSWNQKESLHACMMPLFRRAEMKNLSAYSKRMPVMPNP